MTSHQHTTPSPLQWFFMQSYLNMLSNSWRYIIAVLLAAQVAEATVTISPSCGGNTGAMNTAVTEAIAIAQWAHTRTIALRDGTLPLPEWMVVLNTFNTYFGALATPDLLTGQNGEFVAADAIQVGDVLIGMLFYYNK